MFVCVREYIYLLIIGNHLYGFDGWVQLGEMWQFNWTLKKTSHDFIVVVTADCHKTHREQNNYFQDESTEQ